MPRDRYFVAGVQAAGARVALAADDARKLLTVLRRQAGDKVQIVDAAGTVFTARIDVAGKSVYALIEAPLLEGSRETTVRIVLAQAIPKGQKMDFIVEKATELGVAAIVPLRSARVAGDRTGEHKLERWQRIAKAAAAQSGRTSVPQVEPVVDWDELRAGFKHYDRVFLPWEGARAPLLRDDFEAAARAAESILIVVGPEGGFSEVEVTLAQAAGAVPLSLGPRILRTETAALAVVAILLYARGELG